MSGCPFEPDTWRCPLYYESHYPRLLGCVDDLALPCKVQRGKMNFDNAIGELARRGIAYPGMLRAMNHFYRA